MDGLSEYGIWARIILPLSKPALASLALLTFVNTWNDYMGPFIYLTSNDHWTIQLGLQSFIGQFDAEYAMIMTGSVLSVAADPGDLPARPAVLHRGHRDVRDEGMSAGPGLAKPVSRIPYDAVFATVYAGLRINLCLLVCVSPLLVALAFTGEPLAAWPFFTVLSAICAVRRAPEPSRCSRAGLSGPDTVPGSHVPWASPGPPPAVWSCSESTCNMAVGTRFAAATPLLAVLLALVVAVTTTMLAAGWRLSGRRVLAAAYLSLRKWYLALANAAVLGVLLAAIVAKPAVGLFLLPAPALYVVWANARHALSPLTRREEP